MNEHQANAALAARTTSRQDVIRVLGCSGPCRQGDVPCPCPEQCMLPEGRYDTDGRALLRTLIAALCIAFGGVIAGSLLAVYWPSIKGLIA